MLERKYSKRSKSKRFISMLLVFSMVLFLAVPFAQAETTYLTGDVVVNGSFEEVSSSDATDAIGWDQNGAVASTDFRTGTGSRSLKLKATELGTTISASQNIKVVAGETYNFWFRAYQHTDVAGDDRISQVIVNYLDANGIEIGEDIITTYDALNSAGVWSKREKAITTPAGTDTAQVYIYASNYTGTYYFDLMTMNGAIPPSDLPLSAPTDVTAEAISHEEVNLSWTASEGNVWGYKVLRDGVEVGDVTATAFGDIGLTASTEYSYTIQAYNPDETAISAAVLVTTLAPPPEPTVYAPTNLTVGTVTHNSVALSWTAAEGTVDGYKVLRNGVEVGNITITSFTDSGLAELTAYSYTVEAYNAQESAVSEAVSATTLKNPIVYTTGERMINGSFEQVNPDDTTDAIAWEQNGAVASTDFRTGTGSRSLKLNSSTATATPISAYQEIDVVAGQTYKMWFKSYDGLAAGADRKSQVIIKYLGANDVQVGEDFVFSTFDAVNKAGVWGKREKTFAIPDGAGKVRVSISAENFTGSYYYDLFSLTGAIPVPLTAPTDVTVDSVTYAGAKLSWTSSEGTLLGYRILRDGVEVGNVTTTSFSDLGLTASTNYSYVVEAFSGSDSQASSAVTLTTDAAPIVSGEQLKNSNFEFFEEVTLKPIDWVVSEGVKSTDQFRRHGKRSLMMSSANLETITSAEQNFSVFSQHIYKFRGFFHDPNGVGDAKNPDRVSEVTAHYLDASGQEIGSDVIKRFDKHTTDTAVYKEILREFSTPVGTKEVQIRMHAKNYVGFFLYDWFQLSLIGPAPDAPQPPAAPAKVVGIVTSETTVDVSWTAVTSGNVNSYNVYRDGVKIGSSTVNSFADSGLTANTEYSYTATAVNDIGESAHSPATLVFTKYYNDITPPGTPILHADAESSTKIVLRWKGVDDDVRVSDHEIYRNGVLLTDKGIIMGVYEDKNLTPGTTYNYEVIARDPKGNRSEISNTAYATTFDNAVSQYVEGMVQYNYYINEANADAIYRLGPGYVGKTGLTAKAVLDLPGDAADVVYTQAITDTTKTVISMPISDLAVGKYPVALSILDGDQIIWATEDDVLKNAPVQPGTRVSQIDHDREIMLVDGAPYYPLGIFGVDSDSMQQIADAGFNTTLRWKGYTTNPRYNLDLAPDDPANVYAVSHWLDAVHAAGLYAFESPVKLAPGDLYHKYKDPNWDEKYPIHNEVITPGVLHTAATHPAVIGYYSYDEVDNFYECCPTQSDSVVMQHGVEEWYDIVKTLDPYHSVMTLFAVGISKNADWNAWDTVARDYYFHDGKHMSDVYESMRQSAITADEWNDPFIATPLFEEQSYQRKALNGIQQRASSYSSVISGARGLYYWDWAAVYNDNWDALKQVAGELNQLEPILTERIPLQSVVYSDGTVQNSNQGMSNNVQALVTNHNDKTYMITVNTENAPIEVTFTLPAEHSGVGTVWFEDREIEVVNGTFTDTYEPYARHVYELQGTWVEGNQISIDSAITGAETVYVDPEYAPATKNMIKNSSFEESYGSTPGMPAHWFNGDSVMNSGQSGSDGEWHIDDDESYHGDASMRMTEKEGGIWDDIFWYQVPMIHQGGLEYRTAGTYTYSMYMKADREDVTVMLQEGWGTFVEVQVGTEWARYEVQIVKSGAGGGFANVIVMDQGTVWVDAIQMELAPTATEYEAPILTNPDTYTGSVISHEAPDAPTDLAAAEVGRFHVNLTWTASIEDKVVGYVVYRNGEEIGTSETNAYNDTELQAATEYTYTVKALSDAGLLSENSNEVIVTTLDPASFESLTGLITGYLESGDLSHSVSSQLENKLKQAVKFDEEGKTAEEEKFLNDLISILNNPGQQKNISPEAKEDLLSEINQLIAIEVQ